MLKTDQAVLIMLNAFYEELKGYHLQFLEVISLYYDEAGMQIERCREDCYDFKNLQAVGEQPSPKILR